MSKPKNFRSPPLLPIAVLIGLADPAYLIGPNWLKIKGIRSLLGTVEIRDGQSYRVPRKGNTQERRCGLEPRQSPSQSGTDPTEGFVSPGEDSNPVSLHLSQELTHLKGL